MSSKCYRRRAAVFLCLALFSFANQQTREDALAVGTAVAAVPLCAMPPVSAVGGLNAFGLGLFKLLSKKDAENLGNCLGLDQGRRLKAAEQICEGSKTPTHVLTDSPPCHFGCPGLFRGRTLASHGYSC